MKTHTLRKPPLLLLACCVSAFGLSACGGQAFSPVPPKVAVDARPEPSPPSLTSAGDDAATVREELDRISQRIARERAQANPQATEIEAQQVAPAAAPQSRIEDTSTSSPRCSTDTCAASEGVCGSAQTICAIAQRHPNDREFSESCQWANDRCADATSHCKRCQ